MGGTWYLGAILLVVACKGQVEHIDCGAGTTLRDHTCVANAPPPAAPTTKQEPAAEPSCEDMCKQLVACKPIVTKGELLDNGIRNALDPQFCLARCTAGGRPRDPLGAAGATIPRPDCSKGCDTAECRVAYDWASEPTYAPSKPGDPLMLKVEFRPREAGEEHATLTLRGKVDKKLVTNLANAAMFWWCADPYFHIDSGWLHTGVGPLKDLDAPLLAPKSCTMGWATVASVKIIAGPDLEGPGDVWRPGWGVQKPGGEKK
jgi:hypothetical protein